MKPETLLAALKKRAGEATWQWRAVLVFAKPSTPEPRSQPSY